MTNLFLTEEALKSTILQSNKKLTVFTGELSMVRRILCHFFKLEEERDDKMLKYLFSGIRQFHFFPFLDSYSDAVCIFECPEEGLDDSNTKDLVDLLIKSINCNNNKFFIYTQSNCVIEALNTSFHRFAYWGNPSVYHLDINQVEGYEILDNKIYSILDFENKTLHSDWVSKICDVAE